MLRQKAQTRTVLYSHPIAYSNQWWQCYSPYPRFKIFQNWRLLCSHNKATGCLVCTEVEIVLTKIRGYQTAALYRPSLWNERIFVIFCLQVGFVNCLQPWIPKPLWFSGQNEGVGAGCNNWCSCLRVETLHLSTANNHAHSEEVLSSYQEHQRAVGHFRSFKQGICGISGSFPLCSCAACDVEGAAALLSWIEGVIGC